MQPQFVVGVALSIGILGASAPSHASDETCPWFAKGAVLAPSSQPGWRVAPELRDLSGPFVYYNSDYIGALLYAPWEKLEAALPPTLSALIVGITNSGQPLGLVNVSFAHYRHNETLASYHEMDVSILLNDDVAASQQLTPLYDVRLVVTSEAAQWVGVQGYSLPKIVGDVECNDTLPNTVECTASADGHVILGVSFDTATMTVFAPFPPSMSISVKDQWLVRAPLTFSGTGFISPSGIAILKFGDHPLTQQLKDLDIGNWGSLQTGRASDLAFTWGPGQCTPLSQ